MKLAQGFTLIELMIVVAIVAILAGLAMPQYQKYAQRGYRTEALSAIQMILDAQERYYSDNRQYTTALADLGLASNYQTENKKYQLELAACSNAITLSQCIKVTAKALGNQADDGDIVFTSLGEKTRNGQPL